MGSPAPNTSARSQRLFAPETLTLASSDAPAPVWLADVRDCLAGGGPYLVWEDDEEIELHAIRRRYTHIGRGLRADLRLLHPTVSRRHAVIHQDDLGLTVVDDHSHGGVFVGGQRVTWRRLSDGDQLGLGSLALYLIDSVHKTDGRGSFPR